MLVISRKSGESLRIGDDVVVRVAKTTGSKVSLVIEAPREIPIARTEILVGEDGPPARRPSQPPSRAESTVCVR